MRVDTATRFQLMMLTYLFYLCYEILLKTNILFALVHLKFQIES